LEFEKSLNLGGYGIYRRLKRFNRELFFESEKQKWMYFNLLEIRGAILRNSNITYYEFGTDVGVSLINYMNVIKKITKEHKKNLKDFPIIAFDSFCGLPKSQKFDTGLDVNWSEGDFSCSKEQLLKNIRHRHLDPNKFNLKFVEGFYEDSLTIPLRNELPSPTIINIDCDYYSSTKTILNWLHPILKDGTKFYFDDIWHFNGNQNFGELRAINEFNQNNQLLIPYPVHGMPSQSYIYSNSAYTNNKG